MTDSFWTRSAEEVTGDCFDGGLMPPTAVARAQGGEPSVDAKKRQILSLKSAEGLQRTPSVPDLRRHRQEVDEEWGG